MWYFTPNIVPFHLWHDYYFGMAFSKSGANNVNINMHNLFLKSS